MDPISLNEIRILSANGLNVTCNLELNVGLGK